MTTPLMELDGTAEEIQEHLADFAGQQLHVIVPPADASRPDYPTDAVFRNGVPLFPTESRTDVITCEQVK
jgi:hypothetical protein